MISIDFYTGLLPITEDITNIRGGDTGPLFSDETLSWFEDHNMTVFMEGTQILYDNGDEIFVKYYQHISKMTLGVFANTSCSHCKLVFENKNDAMLFKLTWA